jgi:hypothetical protein
LTYRKHHHRGHLTVLTLWAWHAAGFIQNIDYKTGTLFVAQENGKPPARIKFNGTTD